MVWAAFVPIGKLCRKWREWASGRCRGRADQPWVRLAWQARTALGVPVVPEVYRIWAGSPGPTATGSSSGAAVSFNDRMTVTAPQCSSTRAVASADILLDSGTATPPAASTPK